MRPFTIAVYHSSSKPITRNGTPVRILCIDAPFDQPIVGIIEGADEPSVWYNGGGYCIRSARGKESPLDLFLSDPSHPFGVDVEVL